LRYRCVYAIGGAFSKNAEHVSRGAKLRPIGGRNLETTTCQCVSPRANAAAQTVAPTTDWACQAMSHANSLPLHAAATVANRSGSPSAAEPKPDLLQSGTASSEPGRPRIVAIGGGTGLPTVLRGLVQCIRPGSRRESQVLPSGQLTALVTVTDDGGSSGRLRRELSVLPPGDVRNCLAALANPASPLVRLLQHRFSRGDVLRGHAVGNLMLAGLTDMTGDLAKAIELASEMLSLSARVLPATQEDVCLCAQFNGRRIVRGETAIVSQGRRIVRLSLERPVRPLPDAIRALVNADVIVIGPGSLYTSILPNLLVDGIASTISGLTATRILVANLMTEPGETDGFSLRDHLRVIREHAGFDLFDYVLVNDRPLDRALTGDYAQRGSFPVGCDDQTLGETRARLVRRNLAVEWDGTKIRHEPRDLANAILDLAYKGRPSQTRD
jgi:uncharacterized cofD-like protein